MLIDVSIGAPPRVDPPPLAGRVGLVHLGYLLALPVAGLPGMLALGESVGGMLARLLVIGWLPILIYAMSLATGYRLTRHPGRALLVLAAVPAQLAVAQVLEGGDVFALLYEAAVLAVGAVVVGLALAMLWHRPSGWFGAIVGVGIVAAWAPYTLPLVRAAAGWSLASQVMLGLGALTSAWTSTGVFAAAAQRFNRGDGAQTPEFHAGHGPLLARLSADRDSVRPPVDAPRGRRVVLLVVAASAVASWVAWLLVSGLSPAAS